MYQILVSLNLLIKLQYQLVINLLYYLKTIIFFLYLEKYCFVVKNLLKIKYPIHYLSHIYNFKLNSLILIIMFSYLINSFYIKNHSKLVI
jgi:hypothetical protein